MKKADCVAHILEGKSKEPYQRTGSAQAPMNIALVKYWGKRNTELNLPVTSSLSLSLDLMTTTTVSCTDTRDVILLNGSCVDEKSPFFKRMRTFLDLFRPNEKTFFHVETANAMPTAAGLASSASGFAALTLALDDLFAWQLPKQNLSILARLGSGSASRSIFPGFSLWEKGVRADGLDSFATPMVKTWNGLLMAYLPISEREKPISSTQAMKETVETSPFYAVWPTEVAAQIEKASQAIVSHDFTTLGTVSESSALLMHATMLGAKTPILYWLPETVATLHKVWQARKEGFQVYATMDAGPNVKLLFLEEQKKKLHQYFPEARVLNPVWV